MSIPRGVMGVYRALVHPWDVQSYVFIIKNIQVFIHNIVQHTVYEGGIAVCELFTI